MTYKKELQDKLKNANSWPAFRDPMHLSILNDMADKAFSKNTIEGYIAAVAIYHQISSDMIELLLEDIHFLTQCSLYPLELHFKKRKNPMFGALLDELEHSIDFKQKKDLLSQCHRLNQIRITMVHKLTQQVGGLGLVNRQAKVAKTVFDQIFSLFDDAHDFFRACLHDIQNDFLDADIITEATYSEPSKGKRSRRPQQAGRGDRE
ncbi:MAG: hypothetical protein Q8P28_06255 [Deltaproteobacteria bacterium]|nr:hypothetical protein [Deltaproteobacteria bacterium]